MESALLEAPAMPVGQFRSFGPVGPLYQVGPVVRPLPDGDWEVQVTLVDTAEQVLYRRSQLLQDPVAC